MRAAATFTLAASANRGTSVGIELGRHHWHLADGKYLRNSLRHSSCARHYTVIAQFKACLAMNVQNLAPDTSGKSVPIGHY
jgi:hypothetical protein